jgi:hypothetical protein
MSGQGLKSGRTMTRNQAGGRVQPVQQASGRAVPAQVPQRVGRLLPAS